MTDEGGAANAQNAPTPLSDQREPSRRAFLVSGGVAMLVGAGGGVGFAFARSTPRPPAPPAPPADLVAALATEHTLLASVASALSARPALRTVLTQLRADHEAHAQALAAAIAQVTGQPAAASPAPWSSPPAPAPDTAALRAAETAAAHTGAARAAASTGRTATLLASISACEATHAELLR